MTPPPGVEPPSAVQSATVVDRPIASGHCSTAARNLTFNFGRRGRHLALHSPRRRTAEPLSVVQSTYLTLMDFVDLFRSFMLHARKDLRDLFDQLLATAATAGVTELLLTPSPALGVGGVPPGNTASGPAATASFPSFPVHSQLLLGIYHYTCMK